MSACSTGLIDLTQAVWEPRIGRVLTMEEAREAVFNVVGLVDVLSRVAMSASSS